MECIHAARALRAAGRRITRPLMLAAPFLAAACTAEHGPTLNDAAPALDARLSRPEGSVEAAVAAPMGPSERRMGR